MRAYKAADVDGNGFITRKEFRLLLEYLVFFNKVRSPDARLSPALGAIVVTGHAGLACRGSGLG